MAYYLFAVKILAFYCAFVFKEEPHKIKRSYKWIRSSQLRIVSTISIKSLTISTSALFKTLILKLLYSQKKTLGDAWVIDQVFYSKDKLLAFINKLPEPIYLMHPVTGVVDSQNYWLSKMYFWHEDPVQCKKDFDALIRVVKNENGDWVNLEI